MSESEQVLSYLAGTLIMLLLFFGGYMALFRTKALMNYYLNMSRKQYLNSLGKKSFVGRWYRAIAKYEYELRERTLQKNSSRISTKMGGVIMLFMALLLLGSLIHTIFKVSLGIFINN